MAARTTFLTAFAANFRGRARPANACVAWLAAFLIACTYCMAASSQETMDATMLAARMREARGPIPSAYHERIESVSATGTTTIYETFKRGDDDRIVRDSTNVHTESGTFAGRSWHQNENGIVVSEAETDSSEHYTTTIARVSEPVDAWLLARLDVRGYGTREYVDPRTYLIVRRERLTAAGTIATTYGDFRKIGGRTLAFHFATKNDAERTSDESRVLTYEPGDVPEAAVRIPPSRKVVSFPEGVARVDIPADFRFPHVYVRVTIGGRGLDFVLDTGSSGITLDSRVAAELGLKGYDRRSSVEAGRYDYSSAVVPEMHVGELTMRDLRVTLIPQGYNEQDDVKVVGLLGFDFFATLGVTIDYQNKRVTAVPAEAFRPPAEAQTTDVWTVRLDSETPVVSAKINGETGDRFVIDTGATREFLVFDYFARRHPSALAPAVAQKTGSGTGAGIGGSFTVDHYRLDHVEIGDLALNNFTGDRVTSKGSYGEDYDGLIGPGILAYFTVTFDYAHQKVYLVRNKLGAAAPTI